MNQTRAGRKSGECCDEMSVFPMGVFDVPRSASTLPWALNGPAKAISKGKTARRSVLEVIVRVRYGAVRKS